MVKEIPLTKGYVALVDDDLYEELNEHKWTAAVRGKHVYAFRNIHVEGKTQALLMHRYISKASKADTVDHINQNGLDNRCENLRLCNKVQNSGNQAKRKKKTSSKYKGVCFDKSKKKWIAIIGIDYKSVYLGRYSSETEAAKAYDKAAAQRYGEFAYLNFPESELVCS